MIFLKLFFLLFLAETFSFKAIAYISRIHNEKKRTEFAKTTIDIHTHSTRKNEGKRGRIDVIV